MQIPQELPQFKKEKALLIVSGRLGMDFYLANNSKIKKVKSFRFLNPLKVYTDNEGHFESRSASIKGVLVSGSVRESQKQRLRQELFRKFKNNLDPIIKKEKLNKLYLFAPDYLHKKIQIIIKDNLPNNLKKQIKLTIKGNYLKSSPLDLLKMIKNKKEVMANKKIVKPIKKEAGKLYKKAIKATGVIKGRPSKINPYN
ncbi:MAG TPA: hypothetical protein ENN28_00920 [Candidatus Uhrbacteria bacterium]|nr:hypothetical protein [Candidatus Uhrbacteria bacterium]